jgi:AraC-like DNA-binding protein
MTSEIELEEPILHRVVPDGCIDIIFNLDGHSNGEAASIAGTMTKPIFAELRGRVNYLAVRFLPGGFLHFFACPACHFTDRIIPLEMISGKREHNLTERLTGESRTDNRIELFESYFGSLLMRNNRNDPAVRNALCNILKHKGNIEISQLSRDAGSSQRQLCRKFSEWVGVSPKSFCRIVRFQNTLRMFPPRSRCNLLSIALDGGYYDQSHFIHEFNSYCGLNPSEFLKSRNL